MRARLPNERIVTVFGGSGFIGRYVVRNLALRGWRVRVAVRDTAKANFLRPLGAVGQVAPVFANIRDDASVAAAVQGADMVVNLVGILYEGGTQRFAAVHAEGAARVARQARSAGVQRLIQISSLGADAASPSAYARTKAAGEQAVLAAFPEATILRPSVVFGPEDGFFNLFAGLSRLSPVLPLIGGGHTRFQPVYVMDVADAVMACLDRPETQGKTYQLGGPKTYSFRALMELLLQVTDRRRLLLPLPWGLAGFLAGLLGLLPKPLLTRDQVAQLRHDNVVADGAPGLADLGIAPTAVEVVVPTYLDVYRVGGRFNRLRPTG